MAQPLSPPQAPKYLERPYPSSQKGGTLIAEDVIDLETHEQRLSHPDGYRPPCCPRCGHPKLHRHGYRQRVLLGEREELHRKKKQDSPGPTLRVVRHRCAHPACKACWQTLPALVVRHLWRRWVVVEAATVGRRPHDWPPVPQRTRRRWWARLRLGARVLTQALAGSGSAALEAVAQAVGLTATRWDVVRALGLTLAAAAGLLHRLAPGLRLM